MKKTLKLAIIFGVALMVVSFGALGIYALISNNKTYHIYDLRFVEPFKNSNTFVYTSSEIEYTTIRNKKVYLSSEGENRIPIAIYASTSLANPLDLLKYSSSDSSVADLVIDGNRCYIEYYKVGDATINIYIDKVSDSFKVSVFNQTIDDFYVYDESYYGRFSQIDYFKNKIVSYSDGTEYRYSYKAFSGFDIVNDELLIENASKQNINSELLLIDQDKINTNVFEYVELDPEKKQLVVKCKTGLNEIVDETIFIQPYSVSENGEIKANEPFAIFVHIIAYTPEFLQVELSTNPDFTDNVIFMDTVKPGIEITEENVEDNIQNLTKLLSFEKAEKYLKANGETATYKAFFTEKVSKIYARFRMIYTNGDVVELTPDLEGDEASDIYKLSGDTSALSLSQNEQYFIIDGTSDKTITVTLNKFALNSDFVFAYKSIFSEENVELFYTKDNTTGFYNYTYWDGRTYFDGEICDANGNIIKIGV